MSSSGNSAGERGGRLIVISGPSGTGKTSICRALLERLPNAVWSVSVTTRPMRNGEVSGRSYEYVTPEEFERRKADGEFLETARYCGHLYGTPRGPVEEAVRRGLYVVIEIDVQGGAQVAAKMPDSIRVFILPPDGEELQARLEGRKTEARCQQARRLQEAQREIAFARESGAYSRFVVNDDLEKAIEEVEGIILQEHKHA